jgi:uroporphyrinogen-III synthase
VTKNPVVLITRPKEISGALEKRLSEFGIGTYTYSPIEILPLEATDQLMATAIKDVDIVIFVSPISVEMGFGTISKFIHDDPSRQIVAAVGRSTASVLKSFGVSEVISPVDGSGADALVNNLVSNQVLIDKNVLIVHGEGGGENIATGLFGKVKKINRFVCYKSVVNSEPFSDVVKMFGDRLISGWTATSRGILAQMLSLDAEHGRYLTNFPLFVNHNLIASDAANAGVKTIIDCANATDQMAECISDWFKLSEVS